MMYACLDAALLRVSTPSLGELPPWPDVAGASAEHVRQWTRWLDAVWTQAEIAAAIGEASPVLARRVQQIRDGQQRQPREIRRAVLSVARYVLRARSRATPFGLFAGVAPAHVGTSTTLHWTTEHRAHARIDAEWLTGVITQLERCRPLRRTLRVNATNLARVRDGRLIVDHQARADQAGPADLSMRYTHAVATALRTASTPTPVTDLLDRLHTDFPHTPSATIEGMVAELVEQRVLITNLRPPMTSTDPLGHVAAELDTLTLGQVPEDAATLVNDLRAIHTTITRHNAAGSSADPGALRRAASHRMSSGTTTDRAAVAVDLHADCTLALPEHVWQEAESAATVLTRLSPHPAGTPEWVDYHHRFLERYGIGAHVPVRELLEADTGLGYPAGYRDSLLSTPRPEVTDRDTRLLALAQRAALEGRREVHLTEATVAALSKIAADPHRRPRGELSFRLYAAMRDAIDHGDFTLAVAGVSRAAGTMTGRFLDVLGEAERARLTSAYTRMPTLTVGALPVQLSCPPLHIRTDIVTRSPAVLDHVLSVGEHRTDDPSVIDLDDLAVTADIDRLYLVSRTHGRVVEPTVFHAVEFTQHAHPLMRFLAEITTARTPTLGPFSWGEAASRLPYLPRVRYGRSILAPAQWRLTPNDLPHNAETTEWSEALAAWRECFRVPDEVFLGDGDRRLHLDLTEPAHQQLLRTETDRGGNVALREAAPPGSFAWFDGRAHDIVVPLASTRSAEAGPRVRGTTVREREHGYLPGAGTWFYAKLYGHPERQATLLTEHVPRLLAQWEDIPEWWFLRYADPDPHLRLRIRLDRSDEFGATAQHVGTWASELRQRGLLGGLSLDTYRPETGRFGDGIAMTAAEAVFAADSTAALVQLAHTKTAGTSGDAITAASLVNLVVAYLGTPEAGMRWLIEHVPRTHTPAPDRQVCGQAVEIANPDNEWAALRGTPEGEAVVAAWHRRQQALATYRDTITPSGGTVLTTILRDLAHLHHVRMAGSDPDRERSRLHLARAAAVSWTSRRQRGSA